jgi:DNA-binding response OmpR family regulator
MNVALLEKDARQAERIAEALVAHGHLCRTFNSVDALRDSLRRDRCDLLILDWAFPDQGGPETLRWMQQAASPRPPVLMTMPEERTDALVEGLEAGADDFLVKPIDPAVLTARVHAVLRRAYPAVHGARDEEIGDYAFDPLTLSVSYDGRSVQLTTKEYALAEVFFRNPNQALARTYLLETVWGRNPDLATRTLDAHVSKIRSKLALRPERGFKLAPVYSYGYRLDRVVAEDRRSRLEAPTVEEARLSQAPQRAR